MLSRETYLEWSKSFATMHGFVFESDVLMLSEWFDVLGHYSIEELEIARLAIARSTGKRPGRHEDYLPLIQQTIYTFRLGKYQLGGEQDWGSCAQCSSSGLVSVPHPKCLVSGEWLPPYAETPTTCTCRIGVIRRQSYKADKCLFSLERYDKLNPKWRQQMAKLKAQINAKRHYEKRNKDLADPLTKILSRLRVKFAGREPGIDEEFNE